MNSFDLAPISLRWPKPSAKKAALVCDLGLPTRGEREIAGGVQTEWGVPLGDAVTLEREVVVADVVYSVVRHEDGWAYRVADVLSEKLPTRDEALSAARDAAARQEMPGPTETILYEDAEGKWHEETAQGDDRPHTRVEEP